MSTNTLISSLLCVVALSGLGRRPVEAQAPPQGQDKTLRLSFGLYQSDKATVMYTKFAPVIDKIQTDLEQRLGRPVDIRLEIFRTYDDGINALAKGEIDFVRFGPAPYILAKDGDATRRGNPNLKLLAMELEDGKKRFTGVVIVRKDSPIKELSQLKGCSFAFGDPNSTIGRYLVQAELAKAGITSSDLRTFAYLDRHDKVARAVQVGDYDAGSVKDSTYAELKDSLDVLISFENVTKPWVARSDMDPQLVKALQETLIALKDPAALKELKVSGFCATSDEEYEFVRKGMKQAAAFEAKAKPSAQ
jgi:phosphate/phosphite/phosphonate ABC transporter binding protein